MNKQLIDLINSYDSCDDKEISLERFIELEIEVMKDSLEDFKANNNFKMCQVVYDYLKFLKSIYGDN